MALVVKCNRCDAKAPKHCDTKGCSWAVCPTHGTLRLTADQRKALEADGA